MKICFFGDGGSVHLIRWIDYFLDKNYEIHLVTFRDSKNLKEGFKQKKFYLHQIGNISINPDGKNWMYMLHIIKLKKVLRKIKPDIINAHYVTSYGFIVSLLTRKKFVISAWGSDILIAPKKNFIYKYITKYALKKCCLITSDSEHMTNEIKKYTQSKVITVPMGIDKLICQMKGIKSSNEIIILSLRTVDKNCNIDYIIKAFNKFNSKYTSSKLIIANSGPEIYNIKKLINDLRLDDKVELLGFISRSNLLELLLKSNIYISIPTSDSTSVTLLESMACGILPIVSDLPANREWVIHNHNGLVIENIHEDLLFEALIKAVNDENLQKRCNIENRKIILQRAIWENNMNIIENEYLKLIR
ncbi:glycosyltransferase [Clostridium sp. YIM B02515]|uniref:Glycosyltransferase n=1 Tax=Clostridium rhizosphaerae TaxID=2803861 RepID=A0ABS1TH62_9CLOT|nr:glycosyltransferase [Clostridium rhizosphaerae]MBL4938122.1 glycosyltransferase [Clostridium rhizosphaerae]